MTASGADASPQPPPEAVARAVIKMLMEVDAGLRGARVLTPLFAPHLRGLLRRMRPRGDRARLHRLAVSSRCGNTHDVVAICQHDDRFEAIGLRLDWTVTAGWMVTDLVRNDLTPLDMLRLRLARTQGDRMQVTRSALTAAKRQPRSKRPPHMSDPPSASALRRGLRG